MKRASVLVIIAKISVDMSRFETAGHLISWAQRCPGNEESAGKRHSSRTKKGAPWLKTTQVQCAWAVAGTKDTYFHAQYHRLRSIFGSQVTRMVRQYCSGVIETWRAPHMFSLYFFGLAFWDAFLLVAFLGGLPNFGRATNPSISDRRTTVRPATSTGVSRPRRISSAMA
jgi:hypothetical protein